MILNTRTNDVKVLAGPIGAVAVLIFGLRTGGILLASGLHWEPVVGELLGSVMTLLGAVLLLRNGGDGPAPRLHQSFTAFTTKNAAGFVFALGASVGLLTLQLAVLNAAGPVAWAPLTTSHPLWEVSSYLICYAVLGPIYEELLFRGYLQKGIARTMGPFASVLLPSVLFGFAHWSSLKAMLFAACFGLLLGIYRWWGGSLALCCAIHLMHNLIVYTDKYFFGYFVRL